MKVSFTIRMVFKFRTFSLSYAVVKVPALWQGPSHCLLHILFLFKQIPIQNLKFPLNFEFSLLFSL